MLLQVFREIVLIRTIEKKLDDLFKRGFINGTAHFCIGQEYIPVIISQYLKEEDSVTGTHRGHGHAIAKGLDIKKFLAEVIGKEQGYNSGKGGSQHVISLKNNYFSNGITGGMIPIANGIAFANKYKNNKNLVIAYLGDGAFNEGHVQEALNLAKVLNLPILFICENNQYAMSTPVKKSHSSSICDRVSAMGIKCTLIPDNDFILLDSTSKRIISDMRENPQPNFIEVRTYRHLGHSKNDLNLYRDKAEEQYWFEKDVLTAMRKLLIESRQASEEQLNQIESETERRISEITEEVLPLPANNDSDINRSLFCEK